MLKVNQINCQGIRRPAFQGANRYLDAELGNLFLDPDYVDKYISTIVDAEKTDIAGQKPVTAFVNKLIKTFHILYTPEIGRESAKVKRSINALVDKKPNVINYAA